MKVYVCGACGYEYDPAVGDPDNGIKPGTAFEDLPETGYVLSAAWAKMSLKRNKS